MMVHGFYGSTNEKRDSYGPPAVPVVGLEESKRWATLLFLDRLRQQRREAAPAAAGALGGTARPNGSRTCALRLQSWQRPA
mmetsp:Transcript_996/g.1910  ORF Transcript_996/g.1910 Transcript_996/m.1910 type:complete len:81 (-) Transcript_996:188-430(-)